MSGNGLELKAAENLGEGIGRMPYPSEESTRPLNPRQLKESI